MTIIVPAQRPSVSPCRLAFVGEAPGDEEVEKGKPLVGPSGRIFNALLRTAGIERKDCYVGNVFEEKLPGNSLASFLMPVGEAREIGWTGTPPAVGKQGVLRPEKAPALLRLGQEMLEVAPTVIVPLGGTALWAFLGTDQIGECRGSAALAKFVAPGVKILPTFHPAHVMREWKYFTVVVGDMIKALDEVKKGPGLHLPEMAVVLEPDLLTLATWKERLIGCDLLSVDIETGWGHILCVGFAPGPGAALVVPFVDLRRPNRSYWDTVEEEMAARQFVKEVMESAVPKLGQNFAQYDAFWFLEKWGIRPMNCQEDTRILHHALYPELPKSLAFMGASYTDQGPWKMMRARKFEKKED